MKKAVIVFSNMLIAAASFSAAAQAPDWFAVKHPEIRTMERMRAGQMSGQAAGPAQVAVHDTAVRTFGDDWYAVKHPEIKMMDKMRAEEARERGKYAVHDDAGQHPLHGAADELHRS